MASPLSAYGCILNFEHNASDTSQLMMSPLRRREMEWATDSNMHVSPVLLSFMRPRPCTVRPAVSDASTFKAAARSALTLSAQATAGHSPSHHHALKSRSKLELHAWPEKEPGQHQTADEHPCPVLLPVAYMLSRRCVQRFSFLMQMHCKRLLISRGFHKTTKPVCFVPYLV